MTNEDSQSRADWFSNCGGWSPTHDLDRLRSGIEAGNLDAQDEFGMTALMLAALSGWKGGVDELLNAGANTELRYFRTGETVLSMAVQERNMAMITVLIEGGADPDAANYWGITSRAKMNMIGAPGFFDHVPSNEVCLPVPRIQNAEHLADHHYPRFKIPKRKERETLKVGQAVDLYVYGPKLAVKKDTIKVRITSSQGHGASVRYTAVLETPIELSHLSEGTTEVEFGPENVATVYRSKPGKKSS